jgi:hypothetical protein
MTKQEYIDIIMSTSPQDVLYVYYQEHRDKKFELSKDQFFMFITMMMGNLQQVFDTVTKKLEIELNVIKITDENGKIIKMY